MRWLVLLVLLILGCEDEPMCACGYAGHWTRAQPEYRLPKRCVHCNYAYPDHRRDCVVSTPAYCECAAPEKEE